MERDTQTQEQENGTTDRRIPATVRLDPEDFAFFQEWAEREERSMSQVIRIALERYRSSQLAKAERRRIEDSRKPVS